MPLTTEYARCLPVTRAKYTQQTPLPYIDLITNSLGAIYGNEEPSHIKKQLV